VADLGVKLKILKKTNV